MTLRRDSGMSRPRRLRPATLAMAGVVLVMGGVVVAAQDAPPVTPPATPATPATPPPPPPVETPPPADPPADAAAPAPPRSLDELLGIESESESGAEAGPPAGDPALDAALGGGSLDDMFQLALDGMRRAAGGLEERRTGLDTQRTQEEVMRRLEMLIDEARRQQQQRQSSSSSSSSSSQQQQQQQQDPGSQQSRSQSQAQAQAAAEAAANGTDPQDGDNAPSFQEGPLDGELAESGEEWGALPQRVREMLLQGRSDRFSSLYERLTRAYYRRLAEEAAP